MDLTVLGVFAFLLFAMSLGAIAFPQVLRIPYRRMGVVMLLISLFLALRILLMGPDGREPDPALNASMTGFTIALSLFTFGLIGVFWPPFLWLKSRLYGLSMVLISPVLFVLTLIPGVGTWVSYGLILGLGVSLFVLMKAAHDHRPSPEQVSDQGQGAQAAAIQEVGPPESLPVKALTRPLSGGLASALAHALMAQEEIVTAMEGLVGQGIALTDRRVIILKAGLASGALWGYKSKGFRLQDITSVEFSCGLTEGRIQLTVAGSVEQRQGWSSRRNFLDEVAASRQAENACQFPSGKKEMFQQMAQAIQEATDAVHRPRAPESVPGPTPGAAQRLRDLAHLLQDGLINQAEYEKKRDELVRQL